MTNETDSGGDIVDLLVVGGGVNGSGIACDAAGRGLSVVLCEQNDLASATSQASSKLVHGGLRYLEHYEFRLVRESLSERATLLDKAPHIVKPKRFVLPHGKGMRPAWMVSIGMFLYDFLAPRDARLPGHKRLNLHTAPEGEPLGSDGDVAVDVGFAYSDCTVDDTRLVALNAMQAAEHGARVLTRTALVSAKRDGDVWQAVLRDMRTGAEQTVRTRALVNVAGPWVRGVIDALDGIDVSKDVRPVKGSHIVVERLYEGGQAYILQNVDGRIVFVIPYHDDFTLIGTTEVELDGPPPLDGRGFTCSAEETVYLCDVVNRYFKKHISPDDVVWAFAGVRPLFKDTAAGSASAATREYMLDLQSDAGQAPVLSVFGGKLTTYRVLGEKVMERLQPFFPAMGPAWTAHVPLPGGEDMPPGGVEELLNRLRQSHPVIDEDVLRGLVRRHGTRAVRILAAAKGANDLGLVFGHGLTGCEVDYLMDVEWAETADDILWRRTKLGLKFSATERQALDDYMAGRLAKR